jgi:hypothetical protein
MSYSVSYVVDVPGPEFNAQCAGWPRATDDDLARLRINGTLWDGQLPRANIGFTAELTGLVTLVWLTTKFTVFSTDESVRQSILEWEAEAFVPLQHRRIARVDEFVLAQWESLAGDWWFRDLSVCDRFWQWLVEREPTGWQLIGPAVLEPARVPSDVNGKAQD